MKKGITLLCDPDILRAFLDANKAMFYQRIMGDFSSHRRQNGRVQSSVPDLDDPLPQFDRIPKDAIFQKNNLVIIIVYRTERN